MEARGRPGAGGATLPRAGDGLTLRFSIGDPWGSRDRLLALVAEGRLDPTLIVSHRLALAEAAEAYRLFDTREAVKVVLYP